MASEIQVAFSAGATLYAQIRNRTGSIWNTSGGTGAFVAYDTALISSFSISLSEQGTASQYYTGTWPAAIPAGIYNLVAKRQIGGSVAESDPNVATGEENWNGTALFPLSDLALSGAQSTIKLLRMNAVSGFPLYLKSAADHITPFVSGVVSGQISRDGGAFGVFQSGTVSEVGLGMYKINVTSGDLNAGVVSMVFTAAGISGGTSDPLAMAFVLQRTSGY